MYFHAKYTTLLVTHKIPSFILNMNHRHILLLIYSTGVILCINRGGDVMQAMIRSWGNSQGIILSREVIKSAGVKVGDTLDISVKDGVISLSRPFRHKTLEERIAESNVPLTLSGEMDFGEPKGREIW